MRKHSKFLTLLLCLAVVASFLMPDLPMNNYQAVEPSSSEDVRPPKKGYILGCFSVDYEYRKGSYIFSGGAHWNGSTLTVDNARLCPATLSGNSKYKVKKVNSVKPFKIGTSLGGSPATYALIKEATTHKGSPFVWAPTGSEPVIVVNGVDNGSSNGYAYDVTDSNIKGGSRDMFEMQYKYASSSYNFTANLTDAKPGHNFNIHLSGGSLTPQPNELNKLGKKWTTQKDLNILKEDRDDLISLLVADYPEQLRGLSKEQQRNYVKSHPTLTIKSSKTVDTSCKSHSRNYQEWLSYWNENYVITDLAGRFTIPDVWDDKDIPMVYRIYFPYAIEVELEVNKSLDLELLKGSTKRCNASYDYASTSLKLLIWGNLKTHPSPGGIVKDEDVSVKIENLTIPSINTFNGKTSVLDYKLNTPRNVFKAGCTLSGTGTLTPGRVDEEGYIYFPVEPAEVDQHLKITLYINENHNPKELDSNGVETPKIYENNIVIIEPIIPSKNVDLIAKSIVPTYNSGDLVSNTPPSSVPVNLKFFTEIIDGKDLDPVFPQGSPVKYVIIVDGTPRDSGEYKHIFKKEEEYKSKDITITGFTPAHPTVNVKVELHINGGIPGPHNTPTREATFDNNSTILDLNLTWRKPSETPPPTGVELPEYTRTEDCYYIDKDQPNRDSKILLELGSFTVNHSVNIDNAGTLSALPAANNTTEWNKINDPNGSPIPGKNTYVRGMNWGHIISTNYVPLYPDVGYEEGWLGEYSNPKANGNVCTSSFSNSLRIRQFYGLSEEGFSDFEYTPQSLWNDGLICIQTEQLKFQRDQCVGFFTYWDKDEFQKTNGANLVEKHDRLEWLQEETRIGGHYDEDGEPFHCDCCPRGSLGNGVGATNNCHTFENRHEDHDYSYTEEYTYEDDDGETHTGTRTVSGTVHHDGTCPDPNCGTYVGPDRQREDHSHTHMEYRLKYLKSFVVEYNVKINPLDNDRTYVRDHGTNLKFSRGGYGFAAQIEGLNYLTDYKDALVDADYGHFTPLQYTSNSYIRSPATNHAPTASNTDPYKITEMEEKGAPTRPFSKDFWLIKNPNSKFNFREAFIDLDYYDTKGDNKFPVIFAVMYNVDSFKPAKEEYIRTFYPKVWRMIEANGGSIDDCHLDIKPGICWTNDTLTIRGNMYDDTWATVTENTN